MPESRIRKRRIARPARTPRPAGVPKVNPPWFIPLMCAFFLIGLAWIVVFYVSQGVYPLQTIGDWAVGSWNLVIGFGIIMLGFLMTTRWR